MRLSPTYARVLRGYGPLMAFLVAFLLIAMLAPTVDREVVAGGGFGASEFEAGEAQVLEGTEGTEGTEGQAGTEGGATAGGQTRGRPPAGSGGACPDRQQQIPGDPYSPPCVAWGGGNNGGATAKGVSGEEILVALRVLDEPGFQEALASVAGAQITDRPEDIRRTVEGLTEYFNRRFQFYGRRLALRFYDGRGSTTRELLGGGQEEAQADAIHVAEQIGAFADLSAVTAPYHDALARRKVVAFGAPYMSREWMTDRRPYSWSVATDCSIVTESVNDYGNRRLARKQAKFAGPAYRDQVRRTGVIAPDNPWYQECVQAGLRIARAEGNSPAEVIQYRLDLGTMSNQATNVIAKLKSSNVTTVICGCDPVFPIFLTQKAQEQGYEPEWVVTGTALTDQDIVGQLYDQNQWQRAFGISYLGSPQPIRASLGYNAYKTVRNDEPAFVVDIIYYQMYMLALGVQLAGPNLTPETFERGMFSYPGGNGPAGRWGFGPRNYTPTEDFRTIWWDPNRVSQQNGERGAYVEPEPGKRWKIGEMPPGEPQAFNR